jgi:hypothetical protein
MLASNSYSILRFLDSAVKIMLTYWGPVFGIRGFNFAGWKKVNTRKSDIKL